jgi:PAS domain S-box-containing protein
MPIRLAHIVGRKLGIIAALVLGGAFLLLPLFHWFALVVPLQTELRECSNDALLLAAHLYDPNFTTAERADTLQQLLRLLLTAPEREHPYRGSPGFVDSLGLYSASELHARLRREIFTLGEHLTTLLEHSEAAQSRQQLLGICWFVLIIGLALLLPRYWVRKQQQEEQLRQSEQRLRELLDSLPDLVQSVAPDGHFRYVNQTWKETLGYTDEELPTLRVWDILRPDQLPKCQQLFQEAFRERRLFHVETVFCSKDGRSIFVRGNVTVREDPITGELLTRAIFRDITEEHRQLELLRYQESLSSALARVAQSLLHGSNPNEALPQALSIMGEAFNVEALYLVTLSPQGDAQPFALWLREEERSALLEESFRQWGAEWNRTMRERLLAFAVVEGYGEELPEPYRQRGVRALLWVPISTPYGALWGFIGVEDWKQDRFWSPTERTVLQNLAALVLSVLDRFHAYEQLQRLAEDLLEAHRAIEAHAEELRAANEALRERNREKDRIMSIVSHDLRSPLSGIRGLAELLQGPEAEDPALVREFAQLITEAADQLLDLVNDLLEVTRVESGRAQLSLSEVDLCQVARTAVKLLEPIARSKELTLVLDCPETPVVLTADEPKLRQILNNLLSNAVKFTPRGGQIRTRIRTVEEGVELVVEDTGIGIPPEHLPHLFEKFGPHQRPGTQGERGTGLGMPIVKHFVELHGGKITVESTVGVGTRFTIVLPLQPPLEQLATTPANIEAGSR